MYDPKGEEGEEEDEEDEEEGEEERRRNRGGGREIKGMEIKEKRRRKGGKGRREKYMEDKEMKKSNQKSNQTKENKCLTVRPVGELVVTQYPEYVGAHRERLQRTQW